MIEHNKKFYSLDELKRTRDSLKGYLDNEEVYYFVGAIRYACDEIERLNKELDKTRLSELNKEYIINELEKWLVESIEKHTEDYLDWKYDKNVYLAGSEKLQNVFDKLQELKGADKE